MRREREQRAPVSEDQAPTRAAPEERLPKVSPREASTLASSLMDHDRALDVSTTATGSLLHSASTPSMTGWPRSKDTSFARSSSSWQPRTDGSFGGSSGAALAEPALLSSSSFTPYNGVGKASSSTSTAFSSTAALGEKSSTDLPSRLDHADLIARAREVGRQTVDAIERAKFSMDSSRLDVSSYSLADLSCRAGGVGVPPHRSSDVLASTRAVEALRSSESCGWRGVRNEPSSQATPLVGFASSCASSPRPSTSRMLSPVRAETHPDLQWGAASMIRPLQQRDQQRSSAFGAYPPSPEDDARSTISMPFAAASSSRCGAPWVSSAVAPPTGLSPRPEAWPSRPLESLPSYSRDSPLSPRLLPGSSADHYRAPRISRCSDIGNLSSPRPKLDLSACMLGGDSRSHVDLGQHRATQDAGDQFRFNRRSLWQPSDLSRCKADVGMLTHSSVHTPISEDAAGSMRGSPGKCSSVGANSRLPSPRPFRTLL